MAQTAIAKLGGERQLTIEIEQVTEIHHTTIMNWIEAARMELPDTPEEVLCVIQNRLKCSNIQFFFYSTILNSKLFSRAPKSLLTQQRLKLLADSYQLSAF